MSLLLTYYKDVNSVSTWNKKFSSAAQDVIMYKFKSTNGRNLNSYIEKFNKFCLVEGLERSKWPTYANGQQMHKQYTVPMIESKLFYKENDTYYKTAKGKLYEKYLNMDFNEEEKWFVNYILLMDSTMSNIENYLINRSVEINEILVKNTKEEFVANACKNLFASQNKISQPADLAYYDYLYLNAFYLDTEFLNLYYSANDNERKEFQQYVFENWKSGNKLDCVSKKFVSTNYTRPELIDDLKIFTFSLKISNIKYTDFDSTIKSIADIYSSDYDADSQRLFEFLRSNRNIIEPILMNVYKIEDAQDLTEDVDTAQDTDFVSTDINDVPEKRIDDTTIEGKQQLRAIFAMKKRIAKEKSNYKCEMEDYNGCRYFTSKTTKKNYVEVHHFVPREFRNNFENSIDVLANYITLCPHCHRMIHLSTDRERVNIIRYIYNQRKNRLKNCGIDVPFEDLLNYYNIDSEK